MITLYRLGVERLLGLFGAAEKGSLKRTAVAGGVWVVLGHGATMVLRLLSSLILTRLLFPEAFGLMILISTVTIALSMLSDLGLTTAIIRDERGDDPNYLNTAWTLQILRGTIVAMFTLACAVPAARFYDEPTLVPLLLVTALNPFISAFMSISMAHSFRHMRVRERTAIDVAAQAMSLVVTACLAWMFRSVWALVAGGLTQSVVKTVLSYVVLQRFRHRVLIEKEALWAIFNFSKWILPSSILFLVAREGDRLFLPKAEDFAILGIYGLAITLSEPLVQINYMLSRNIVYPVLSRKHREDPALLAPTLYRIRKPNDLFFVGAAGLLASTAPGVIDIMYDPRYAAAGWMLSVMCIRIGLRCTLRHNEHAAVALGKPQYSFYVNLARTVWVVAMIPALWYFYGVTGFVWASGLMEVPVLLVLWFGMLRNRLLRLHWEAAAVGIFGVFYLVGLPLEGPLHMLARMLDALKLMARLQGWL